MINLTFFSDMLAPTNWKGSHYSVLTPIRRPDRRHKKIEQDPVALFEKYHPPQEEAKRVSKALQKAARANRIRRALHQMQLQIRKHIKILFFVS